MNVVIPRILVREETVWSLGMTSISPQYLKQLDSYITVSKGFMQCLCPGNMLEGLVKAHSYRDSWQYGGLEKWNTRHHPVVSVWIHTTSQKYNRTVFLLCWLSEDKAWHQNGCPAWKVLLKMTKQSGVMLSTQSLQLWPCSNTVFPGDNLTLNHTNPSLVVVLDTVELIFEGYIRGRSPD